MSDRIRDLAQDGDGTVLLWTDTGKLIRLTANRTMSAAAERLRQLPVAARQAVADCGECHALDEARRTAERISLWGVVGRDFAAGDGALYSPAMKDATGTWDAATLDRFLADPQAVIPGTNMQFAGIPDAETRRQVIEYLETLR
jgi:cytochrome c